MLTNYVAVFAVGVLGLYALLARREGRRVSWRGALAFALGGVGPFVVLCWYGYVCYGSPLRPGTDFQNPIFKDEHLLLGMFTIPTSSADFWRLLYIAQLLAFSPFRGVFWFSPVLLLGVCGLLVWLRERTLGGGGARVPRRIRHVLYGEYFLQWLPRGLRGGSALPGAGHRRFSRSRSSWPLRAGAGSRGFSPAYSVAINLLLTATDAQNPVGVGGHARVERSAQGMDLRSGGRIRVAAVCERPRLAAAENANRGGARQRWRRRWTTPARSPRSAARIAEQGRREFLAAADRGEPSPLLLGSIVGPVSVNPVGAFEGLLNYVNFPPHSEPVRWASFNVGELIWPESRWSLLPLLLVSGGLGVAAWRVARQGPTKFDELSSSREQSL